MREPPDRNLVIWGLVLAYFVALLVFDLADEICPRATTASADAGCPRPSTPRR